MSVKISKSLAKKIALRDEPLTQERETALMAADVRSSAQNELIEIDENLLKTLNEVFGDTELMNDKKRLQTIVTQRKIIYRNFVRAGHASLAMGNALLDMEASLTIGERERLKQSAEKILPFGDTVASMLRSVARFVKTGKVPENDLPASYSAAYVLTNMTDPELDAAKEEGLVRPEVGRRKLLNFRKDYRERTEEKDFKKNVIDLERLENKREKILNRRKKLALEYFKLSYEFREINKVIRAIKGS
ncbi:hypothetical protein BJI49_13400 [Acetobacter pasteurianus]|nr:MULTISPECIES: hypothetical protein [Acetobacter]MDN7350780.1 hypothetical protein [Acetobacter senegalensis]RCL04416.1 hypothetical protein BJI49_13400 [Acetobacter pasteurianus]GAB31821.1 hypothetical protein APS_2423 [Acetobacter pasteurianus subsp. pasteurianus LMG 1262 = NBRC 106471]GCD51162.1 hypothetical protein NBRC106471_2718 [Acetobacter pasteurianus subsp. pasteurianus LMG 1262 = NBRC 106471]